MPETERHVCEMCGVAFPECGSWVKCKLFNGWVCDSCHAGCVHLDTGTSLGGCKARYEGFGAEKKTAS